MERAWNSGFDVLIFTVDTWQLGWRPTDIKIANYMCVISISAKLEVFVLPSTVSTIHQVKSGTRMESLIQLS